MRTLILFFVFFSSWAFAQKNNFIEHKVKAKETVFSIAKKYQVTPFDIYRLNPDSREGVQENTVLLIPKAGSNGSTATHKVAAKETLFGIAKKYKVSVSDLEKWNKDSIKDGLKIDQEIYISKPNSDKKVVTEEADFPPVKPIDVVKVEKVKTKSATFSHSVLAQETKYGIATKYGISVEELEKLNPQIVAGLKIGEVLTIKTSKESKTVVDSIEKYEVQPKETLYSLTKKLNISQEELIAANPELKDGLREGMVLVLPSTKSPNDTFYSAKSIVNLLNTVDKKKQKELVLLLPFNVDKITSDPSKTQTEHLRTNKFLNLTLDFYAGALMAIDSARVLGLPVNVRIYDIESSKNTSNVASVIAKNDFSNVSAVIGPFQNSHVENTAHLLSKYDIPVISPLSKEKGLALPNLYYAIPSEDRLKANLFNYCSTNNGNVIAIISSKKTSSKNYLNENYPDVKQASFTDKGELNVASLKTQLVKGKTNYIIVETEGSGTILKVTNSLKTLQKEFDIQMVVYEVYSALNFEGIPMKNLTDLKMMYPSAAKVIETPEELIFAKEYKKVNNVLPNAVAVKGFDTTFDTILRICQEEGFAESALKYKTEQVENSFDYSNEEGSNNNNGCYLLFYDNDLTIKKVQ
ncbi:LysM peptidoglycan-binding domain-containing protein [Flavobacterium ardleyense]|uniref:LysM peptidoglycan-binding domain-containing protein n=1 Tax=Flavobacterium ardleyense TaxID=2038737 RepID=A0ABW5Z979_9FLAO